MQLNTYEWRSWNGLAAHAIEIDFGVISSEHVC